MATTKTTTKKRVRWTHTCYGGERKTFRYAQHRTCPTCGDAPAPLRRRRSVEDIYHNRLERLLNRLEAEAERAHDDIQALDAYESDRDVDVSHRDITLNSGIQAAVDDFREALIQAYAKAEGVHR